MRQVLTSDRGGYYTTTRTADQFGRAGDFITSPEISQVFGELCGIWFMTEWLGQGRKSSGVQLIEMGPGRGTLMSDILRTIAQFKAFARSIDAVWMIEAGEGLRMKQAELLCGKDAEMKKLHDGSGWECVSTTGIPVRWVEDIALLPKPDAGPSTPFIIAHEFFDALPIHAFESVAPSPNAEQPPINPDDPAQAQRARRTASALTPQWRELLVTPKPFTPSFLSTPAELSRPSSSTKPSPPDFQLTLSKASTPTSLILPSSPRYTALLPTPQSRIEISPESTRYIRSLTQRITSHFGGAALIIDYGPLDTIPVDSLRGIRGHSIVSPFAYPGETDVSADVDFLALANAALEASPDVEVYGPVEQGAWLKTLGIEERAAQLKGKLSEEKRAEFESGWKRLVESGAKGMGKAYKVMGIVPGSGGGRRPVGFGGGVEEV